MQQYRWRYFVLEIFAINGMIFLRKAGYIMPKFNDRTTMGGSKNTFRTTCWTEILNLRTSDETRKRLIINDLLSRYWRPVYCYLRRKGYNNEPAKDLTQGFFNEIVLGRELFQQADRAKGTFRYFLLKALDRYAIDMYRRETASKRNPADKMFQLDDIDLPELPAAASDATPEQGFHYAWVSDLLDQTLSEVKDEYFSLDKGVYWEVFYARCVAPIMINTKPPSLTEICAKYGVEERTRASNMIATVKRRLGRIFARYLQQYVPPNSDVEQELSELLKNLPGKGAR
jgi:DNA-directed RNA polymerase specialized sigma24 family protein